MVDFNPDQTQVLFFDIEWYVPPDQRISDGASLLANPNKPNQLLLGGVFKRYFPLKKADKENKYQHIWIWKENNEKQVIQKIYDYFKQSWNLLKNKSPHQADLMVCGQGISRFDLPIIYTKSLAYKIDSPDKIWETYYKTKHLDLSNIAIPFYPQDSVMYPKTANQLTKKFTRGKFKPSGKRVWDMYDDNEHNKIMNRTLKEVKDTIRLYRNLSTQIYESTT